MRQAWGETDTYEGFWWGVLKEKENFGNLGVDGRITIFTFKKKEGMARLGQGHMAECHKNDNEPSGSIKYGAFLD